TTAATDAVELGHELVTSAHAGPERVIRRRQGRDERSSAGKIDDRADDTGNDVSADLDAVGQRRHPVADDRTAAAATARRVDEHVGLARPGTNDRQPVQDGRGFVREKWFLAHGPRGREDGHEVALVAGCGVPNLAPDKRSTTECPQSESAGLPCPDVATEALEATRCDDLGRDM